MPTLTLESLLPSHADALFEGLTDPELYRFVPGSPPVSVQALRDRYAFLSTGHSPDGSQAWLNWAIWSDEDQAFVGYVQATGNREGSADIAYVLLQRFWGRGLGRAAVRQMLEVLREEHGVRHFSATVDTRNVRSARLLEELGFRPVETRPDPDDNAALESRYLLDWPPAR